MGKRPRILLTGFSSFPGVPANPTEALVEALRDDPKALGGYGDVHLAVLAVEYLSLPARLEALGREVRPDIALHFGVSGRATAFVVETLARNAVCTCRPDNVGHVPADPLIRAGGGGVILSRLPAEAIGKALARQGIPAMLSDDAGDYLCNTLFYLSCGGHCPPFAPTQAGFLHVPPFGMPLGETGRAFDLPMLVAGAGIVCRTCAEVWAANNRKAAEANLAAS